MSEGGTSHFLPFCWYIPVQLFFYLVFYFAVKGTRNNVVRMIVVFLLTVLYCLLVYYVGFNGHWIAPSFCFFFGCIYSFIDKKRVQLYYPIILLIIAGLTSKIRLVSSPLFCIGIAMLSDYLDQYTNEYLSKRFYHFYLAQGFSLILLVIVVPEINNNLLLCLGVSVLLQIVFTEILYRIDTFLKKI